MDIASERHLQKPREREERERRNSAQELVAEAVSTVHGVAERSSMTTVESSNERKSPFAMSRRKTERITKVSESTRENGATLSFESGGPTELHLTAPLMNSMPNVEKIPWFHPDLSRTNAERYLLQNEVVEGTYLLRGSQSSSDAHGLSLSVRCHSVVKHFKVQWDGQHFCLGPGKFRDVKTLLENFDQQPLIRDSEGTVQLAHPYHYGLSKPHYYDVIDNKHAEGLTCQYMSFEGGLVTKRNESKSKISKEQQQCSLQQERKHSQGVLQEIQRLQQQVDQLKSELAAVRKQHATAPPVSGRGAQLDGHLVQRGEVHIQAQIGTGGWGAVAEGVFRGQKVAVKQPHYVLICPIVVERLEREMRIMAAVRHPNLVRFLGGVLDEQAHNLQAAPLIILELLDTNLRTAYKQGQVTVANKLTIFQDIAYALHYLHEYQEPIIHRDVSSPNILLKSLSTGIWRAKLSDFGSANLARCSVTIGEGAFMYSAPEMFMTSDHISPSLQTTKLDVYSYGIVLCEVTAEKMPEPPTYHFLSLLPQVRATWRDIHDLVLSCTKHNPRERPTMATVIDCLCTMSPPAQ